MVPIPAPLPNIAEGVMNTPRVGRLQADGVGLAGRVASEPGVIPQLHPVISVPEPARVASAACVFPLSLGRQSVTVFAYQQDILAPDAIGGLHPLLDA